MTDEHTWRPINHADPTTLPTESDADENGRVYILWPHGTVGTERIAILKVYVLTFCGFHWAPRSKQVPPKLEE